MFACSSLEPNHPLQHIALRLWSLKFDPLDHAYLHQSHVFSALSRLISQSDEPIHAVSCPPQVSHLTDITKTIALKTSSKQAAINALMDHKTDTFWSVENLPLRLFDIK